MGQFSRYTLRTRSQIKATLVSNPIESVHASWHGMGPHTRGMCFKIQKNPNSLMSSHTLIDLVHKIQPNSPFAAFD